MTASQYQSAVKRQAIKNRWCELELSDLSAQALEGVATEVLGYYEAERKRELLRAEELFYGDPNADPNEFTGTGIDALRKRFVEE